MKTLINILKEVQEQIFKGDIIVNRSIVPKINKELSIYNKDMFDKIPLQPIFDILKKYKMTPLQEDGTKWDGFLLGRTATVRFELGYDGKVIKNFMLNLYWYKHDTNRYEINVYLS